MHSAYLLLSAVRELATFPGSFRVIRKPSSAVSSSGRVNCSSGSFQFMRSTPAPPVCVAPQRGGPRIVRPPRHSEFPLLRSAARGLSPPPIHRPSFTQIWVRRSSQVRFLLALTRVIGLELSLVLRFVIRARLTRSSRCRWPVIVYAACAGRSRTASAK